jgi:hypothetical protein
MGHPFIAAPAHKIILQRSVTVAILFPLLAGVAIGAAKKGTTPETPRIMPAGQAQADLKAYLLGYAPKFVAPTDPKKWTVEAERLRQRVLDKAILRGAPKAWLQGPPRVVWGDTITAEGYFIRKLRYEAVPRLWVGGLLYEPAGLAGKAPAVMNVNGHVGKPGMTVNYKQARCINLVKRGMLALNLEWIGMGQLSGPGYAHRDQAYLDLCGRAGVSVFYLAMKRGLDILCSHKATDLDRVAVTGLSGGGWQTIVISSLDTRVKLSAPNAGYIGVAPRIEYPGDTGDLEQNASDLVSVADYAQLTALLAPRPALLIYNAKDDCCFPAERALASVYEPVKPVYKMFGQLDRFAYHVNTDPGTHNYLKDNREAFYRFLNRHFVPEGKGIDEDLPVDNEIRSSEALAIAYPADNANFYTLAADMMQSLPSRKRPSGNEAAINRWRRETRAMLREIVQPEADLSVDPNPARVSTFTATIQGAAGSARLLRLSGKWTLPLVEYAPAKINSDTTTLILADRGLADARDLVAEALGRGERATVVDLLFTGECAPADRAAWSFAEMIAAVGRRPLGIQVSQLGAVVEWIKRKQTGKPLQVITKGRVAGLAALVYAALEPQGLDRLELRDMDKSLKDLLAKKVRYDNAPSMFCFGLLELVDMPELLELAKPTRCVGF